MGAKDFFKNQTGLPPVQRAAIKDNLSGTLADVESPAHTREIFEERAYLLPDIDYSKPSNFVRYGLAHDYYTNAFERIQKQYPYDGSAAEKLSFYNDLTPLEKYIFNEKYPKNNGFVTLGVGSYGGDATAVAGFGNTSNPQYIRFYGGPHEGNVVDARVGQENNLHLDLSDGFTIEFWLRKNGNALTSSQTNAESLVNIRNESDTQRFYLYLTGATGQSNRIYYHQENFNGTAGTMQTINSHYFDLGTTVVTDNEWRHYAFTFKKGSGDKVESKCYVNGQKADSYIYSLGAVDKVYTITGSVVGTINASGGEQLTADPSADADLIGAGKAVSASYDDFRIWKTRRTPKQIGLNWFRNVDGGTNTDETKYFFSSSANNNVVDLGVYFKFNEGIISATGTGTHDPSNEVTSSTAIGDNLIVDYSGRINNGVFIGYNTALSMRSTDSAIVLSSASLSEEKDPLLFTENAAYSAALTPLQTSGSNHDVTNPTALYNNLPQWIRDDDLKSGSELKKLLQIVGSYFDTIHAQIEHLKDFREAKYITTNNKTTDYVSELLKSYGFNVPELFVDPDVLASIFDQDEKRIFEDKLYNLKNKVYKNIYANLSAIYKSKGTEKGFRNLFRCYGTDDELFKINLYADNVEYQIDDKTYQTLTKKRLVDFSGFESITDREAVIYQFHEATDHGADVYGFYPTSSNAHIPLTVEAQIVFPNKPDIPSLASVPLLQTASLFGVHSASLDHENPSVPLGTSDCDFQVQARRDDEGFTQFALTSATAFFPTLTSSFFYDEEKLVYDDMAWNLAVRIFPKEYPFSSFVTSSLDFTLNFYGVKTLLGEKLAEFDVSETITAASASQFLTDSNKRFYIGADRTNMTGSINYRSDVKFGRFMVWNSFLTNEEITKHNRNIKNYGVKTPAQNAFMYESTQQASGNYVPRADTLALNWEFDTILSHSDIILDSTSGSLSEVSKYGLDSFGLYNGVNYPATGSGFSTENNSTVLDLIQSTVIHRPDSLYGDNAVTIKNNDFESHKINKKPVKFYFSFEASHNEVLSRDMLNFFSDVVEFNNLYGEQIHQYRQTYKELENFKRFYFSKIDKVEDMDKFVNLYKFLDNALDAVLKNIIPASAATSEKIRTVVEDHVLDRHKYVRPYPKLLQEFEENINEFSKYDNPKEKDLATKASDLDSNNIDQDKIVFNFTDRDVSVPLASPNSTKFVTRANLGKVGVTPYYRNEVESALNKTIENTRISADGEATTVKRFSYVNLKERRDRGALLVGTTEIDTYRTQRDVDRKGLVARASATPYTVTADVVEPFGAQLKAENSLLSNTFDNEDTDGYKITLIDFPIQDEVVGDITDTSIYGAREYQIKLENRSNGETIFGQNSLPESITILSSSNNPYTSLSIDPENYFRIQYNKHDSSLATVGNKVQDSQIFKEVTDREEEFSIGFVAVSPGDPVEIYLTSPQVTTDNAGNFTNANVKPTRLVREKKKVYVTANKQNYNWDGQSLSVVSPGLQDIDVSTTRKTPSQITYSIQPSPFIEDPSGGDIYDRIAVSRSFDRNDNSFYTVSDRSLFRSRKDVETEEVSPNANLNYKHLSEKKALQRAFSTSLTNNGGGYRTLGNEIGKPIHSVMPNPHFVLEPVYALSFNIDYDNAYLQRPSQNDYDLRWFRSSNLVRVNATNHAPFFNSVFANEYTGSIGQIINYKPLTGPLYNKDEIFTLPHVEEQVSTTTFGVQNIDFAGTSIVVNRSVDIANKTIDPTTNNYINPSITATIPDFKRLSYYLKNSNGPYQYSLEARRLNFANAFLTHPMYLNTLSYETGEDITDVETFNISPISSKARPNIAVIETQDGQLFSIEYEIFYGQLSEYFNENSTSFVKIPKHLLKPILELKSNEQYNTIFSEAGKQLNGHKVKYFEFSEQIFPRRQKRIQILDHYEIDTDFPINKEERKVQTTTNSLGQSLASSAYVSNTKFSSWSTETFPHIVISGEASVNDGELLQLNYSQAHIDLTGGGGSPYTEGYYNQTYGYRINHKNKNDSIVPTISVAGRDSFGTNVPYKQYSDMIRLVKSENQSMSIVAEYRSETAVDSFLQSGCNNLTSELSLFGFDHGTNSRKLAGLASYSDELFELKDMHEQIDKF